jgi:hypothetical protein
VKQIPGTVLAEKKIYNVPTKLVLFCNSARRRFATLLVFMDLKGLFHEMEFKNLTKIYRTRL